MATSATPPVDEQVDEIYDRLRDHIENDDVFSRITRENIRELVDPDAPLSVNYKAAIDAYQSAELLDDPEE